MGAWGTGLYQDDLALDVKESYDSLLNNGKTYAEANKLIIEEFDFCLNDQDEAPVFWLVLANVQMKHSCLEEETKTRAMESFEHDLQRWKEASPAQQKKREQVLLRLKQRLLTYQPKKKPPLAPKTYHCDWQDGDVFAYPISGDNDRSKDFKGRFFLFHKIRNSSRGLPRYTFPIMRIKITEDETLPTSKEEFERLEYVKLFFAGPFSSEDSEKIRLRHGLITDEVGLLMKYQALLYITSKRSIPKKLIYLGNYQNVTPPHNEYIDNIEQQVPLFIWETLEESLCDNYLLFNLRQAGIFDLDRRSKEIAPYSRCFND